MSTRGVVVPAREKAPTDRDDVIERLRYWARYAKSTHERRDLLAAARFIESFTGRGVADSGVARPDDSATPPGS